MEGFVELHLGSRALDRFRLPDITYPLPISAMDSALAQEGQLPLDAMLYGLQEKSANTATDWPSLEPAMDRLAELVAPEDPGGPLSATGEHWWLEVGPVDLTQAVVTLQRGDHLVAAIAPRPDGRLRAAAYRPLDAKSARSLIALAQRPHPEHGVCMRENNWEYALDAAAGMGNVYAAERGEAYRSYWALGVGLDREGNSIPEWWGQRACRPRPSRTVVAELGIADAYAPAP